MLADSYEAVTPERLHGWLDGLLLDTGSLMLDVGAGSGRDAAWLAGLGHDVVAVEPSPALRAEVVQKSSLCEKQVTRIVRVTVSGSPPLVLIGP